MKIFKILIIGIIIYASQGFLINYLKSLGVSNDFVTISIMLFFGLMFVAYFFSAITKK